MNDQALLERITLNPNVLTGKPVIKGTRLAVEFILGLLAHGATTAEIMDEYEGLHKDFGEMIFREKREHHGVIFLRLNDERSSNKIEVLSQLLDSYSNRLADQFVTVTETKVRFV